jgi:hypothetical protein
VPLELVVPEAEDEAFSLSKARAAGQEAPHGWAIPAFPVHLKKKLVDKGRPEFCSPSAARWTENRGNDQ